jgi:hypothetical protein
MPDGIIELDSEVGRMLGFTSDRFSSGSYLWKRDEVIAISFIESLNRGNFRELVQRILSLHFSVHIPTPLGRMQEIVRKNGYRQTFLFAAEVRECVEVWVLEPIESEGKNMSRIQLNDSSLDAIYKISEGNPRAVTVIARCLTEGGQIDPDLVFGGLGVLLILDSLQIYGSHIWILFQDVCGSSLVHTIAALRAVQLGLIPESQVKNAITSMSKLDTDAILTAVQGRLPKFGQSALADAKPKRTEAEDEICGDNPTGNMCGVPVDENR